jgi:pyruvate dehydrogenase E1 component beta subunit
MPSEEVKFTEAIFHATRDAMERRPEVYVIGLGVSYPNGADGTMGNLGELFPDRVLDTPVSEAAVTGAALGSAISGMRPVVHHGRVEFALFAADQIITQASKWNYMFGGNYPAPIVFRIAVGRQWGNGPQHTQALYSLFGAVPGLKVVIPSSPYMAKGLLAAAIEDPNPVVFLEPRWLYQLRQDIPIGPYSVALSKARIVKSGNDVTLVAYGDGVVAASQASNLLSEQKVDAEIIDLVSINPFDFEPVLKSVAKTGRLVTVDTTSHAFSVGKMVIAEVLEREFHLAHHPPLSIAGPNVPVPTATSLTEAFYPNYLSIANEVLASMGKPTVARELSFEELHLPPSHSVVA